MGGKSGYREEGGTRTHMYGPGVCIPLSLFALFFFRLQGPSGSCMKACQAPRPQSSTRRGGGGIALRGKKGLGTEQNRRIGKFPKALLGPTRISLI